MNLDRTKGLIIAFVLILPGALISLTGGTGEVEAIGPLYYHNSYIELNVSFTNGTPAEGYRAVWNTMFNYNEQYSTIDIGGKATLNLSFNQLGAGMLRIRDPSYMTYHTEYLFIGPDKVVYRNITIPPPEEPYNLITGILRDAETNEPIENAEVHVQIRDDLDNDFHRMVYTNPQGRYETYVPNGTRYNVIIQVYTLPGYRSLLRAFFLKEEVHTYDVDLYAYKEFSAEQESRVRYVNPQTGDPLTGYFSISSCAEDNDLNSYDNNAFSQDMAGWFDISTSRGEMEFRFTALELYPGTDVHLHSGHVINDTGMDIEIPVDTSFMVPVEMEVWNSTGPASDATIHFNIEGQTDLWNYQMNPYYYTDASGKASIHLPSGGIHPVNVLPMDQPGMTVSVDTTGPGPYRVNLTVPDIQEDPLPPLTRVNITVLDDITGLAVPRADINGWGYFGDTYVHFSDTTGDDGICSTDLYSGMTYSSIYTYVNMATAELHDMTFTVEGPNDVTMRMTRRYYTEGSWAEDYYLVVKDDEGQPATGAEIYVEGSFSSVYYYSFNIVSDVDGKVEFRAMPESEVSVHAYQYLSNGERNPWAMQWTILEAHSGMPYIGDVTVYERPAPTAITGFIRDAETMAPVGNQDVRAHSVKPLPTEPSRAMMMIEEQYYEGIDYMNLWRMSTADGFYRTYGIDTVMFKVDRSGYFTYREEYSLQPVRSGLVHDILLEPLPDQKAWLNGTLMSENGEPIPGEINITDIGHPGMAGYDLVIDTTGAFGIQLWPSTYRLRFYNETLSGMMDVMLPEEGIDGLELRLIPMCRISGRTVDGEGTPIEGINVTLVVEPEESLFGWSISDVGGNFSFTVPAGTYSIVIGMSELYDNYRVNDIEVDGWVDWFGMLYLNYRTQGDVLGTVLGSAGPYAAGVPGTVVELLEGKEVRSSTTTDIDGRFVIPFVNYGTYDLRASPPESLLPVEGLRSGYLGSTIADIVVSSYETLVYPQLTYVEHISPEYVNITHTSPNGTGEYLDEPVMVTFSEVMNRTSVESSIFFSPEVQGISFSWDEWGYVVTVRHEDLQPNTTYTVTVGLGAVSSEGWPLWGNAPYYWEFTTGNATDPWTIFSAEVELQGMNLSVFVNAPTNLSIWMCIMDVGYFRLTEEGRGGYSLELDETHFEPETVYEYFFTDRFNGDDKAPEFKGTFTTPEGPVVEPVWELSEATVTVLSGGDWKVRAKGNEELTVYIVIDGVGSFILQETAPGEYSANILSDNFKRGKTYDYHFSDREDGPDLAPQFAGSAEDPRGPTTISDGQQWVLICLITLVLILLVAGLVILVAVLASRRKDREGLEEE
ncbi:MAG: Ig-like domain-containing protein [Candidatus Thermoplasmatota archaeon]|nr:Ig-like domain-containing protein [Candidatus Thermoplasmatota archaeon]